MCFTIGRNKISLLHSASKFVANLCLCQKLNEVLRAPRLTGRALCTDDTHLLKPNLTGCAPGPRRLTEACEAKLKEVKAETRGNSKPKEQKSRPREEAPRKSQWDNPEVF